MRVRALLLVAVLVAKPAICPAEEPPSPPLEQLVRDLNAPSRAARDAAEQALLGRGPDVLPAVIAARARAAGEAAFRLRGIQRRLEEAEALDSVERGLATLAVTVARVEPLRGAAGVRILLRAAWQPPLEPLAMRLPLASIVAEGPAGEAVPVAQRQAVVEPAIVAGQTAVDLPITLVQPQQGIASLGSLRGTLRLWLAGRQHAFELPLGRGAGASLTVARAAVTLEEAAVRGGRLLVTARVTYDAPSEALASHRPWLALCPLEVVGDDGRPLARIDQTTTSRSDRGITTTAEFTLAGAPVERLRLRWRLPMALHEAPFDFLVRDVSLPARD